MARPDPWRQVAATAQAVSERYMNEVATVERWSDGTFDPNDPGGTGEGWTTIATTVGRLDLASNRAEDRMVAEQHSLAEVIAAVLPAGTDARQEDRVTVGGVSLIARAIQNPSYDAHIRVVGESP